MVSENGLRVSERYRLQYEMALQDAGVQIAGTVAIFSYGFEAASQAFAAKNIPFYTLCNLSDLLQKATEMQYIDAQSWETIMEWQKNPSQWKQP